MNFFITFTAGAFILAFMYIQKIESAILFILLPALMATSALISFRNYKSGKLTIIDFGNQADNQYSLGFLFTLLSLFIPLTRDFVSADTTETAELINLFGIALSTTITGILLRTVMVSRGGITSDSKDTNDAPSSLSIDFLPIANQATQALNNIENKIDQIANNRVAENTLIQPSSAKADSAYAEEYSAISHELNSIINELGGTKKGLSDFKGRLTRLTTTIDESILRQEKLQESSENLNQINESLSKSVELFGTLSDINQQKISPFVDSIVNLAEGTDQAIFNANKLSEAHEKLKSDFETTIYAASSMASAASDASDKMTETNDSYKAVSEAFENMSINLDNMSNSYQVYVNTVTSSHNILQDNITKLQGNSSELLRLEQNITNAREMSSEMASSMESNSEKVNSLSDKLALIIGKIDEISNSAHPHFFDKLDRQIKSLEAVINAHISKLGGLTERLIDALKLTKKKGE